MQLKDSKKAMISICGIVFIIGIGIGIKLYAITSESSFLDSKNALSSASLDSQVEDKDR